MYALANYTLQVCLSFLGDFWSIIFGPLFAAYLYYLFRFHHKLASLLVQIFLFRLGIYPSKQQRKWNFLSMYFRYFNDILP